MIIPNTYLAKDVLGPYPSKHTQTWFMCCHIRCNTTTCCKSTCWWKWEVVFENILERVKELFWKVMHGRRVVLKCPLARFACLYINWVTLLFTKWRHYDNGPLQSTNYNLTHVSFFCYSEIGIKTVTENLVTETSQLYRFLKLLYSKFEFQIFVNIVL